MFLRTSGNSIHNKLMDDYINKKRKSLNTGTNTKTDEKQPEIESQILIRQSRNQINLLNGKIEAIQQSLTAVKQKLKRAHVQLQSFAQRRIGVLDKTPVQKPLVENTISNRQTQKSTSQLRQPVELEPVENLAERKSNQQSKRRRNKINYDKLSQTSVDNAKTRTGIKKIKMDV